MTRRWRSALLIGALVLSCLILVAGARTVHGLERLEAASASARGLEPELAGFLKGSSPNLASLRGRVDDLQMQLAVARGSLTPFIQLAPAFGWVPSIGPRMTAAKDSMRLGELLTQAASDLLSGADLAGRLGPLSSGQLLEGNRVPEQLLLSVEKGKPFFLSASNNLAEASVVVRQLKGRPLPEGVPQLLAESEQLIPLLNDFAQAGLSWGTVWRPLLGFEGSRTYLIVAQNADELRATGGFIPGAWIVTVDHGEIIRLDFIDAVELDDLKAGPLPPEGLLITLWAGVWLFRDAAWFPEYAKSAQAIEGIYQLSQDTPIDGVIALNQGAVQGVLLALGPIPLPTGQMMNAETFMPVFERTTDAYGRAYLDTILQAMMDKLREQGASGNIVGLLSAGYQALHKKDVLLSFKAPALQAFAEQRGWTGSLRNGHGDVLMIVDSNVGFSKVNRNISQRISYQVDLDLEAPKARLDISYINNSTSAIPRLCALQSATNAGMTYEDQKNACYWDYLRVYVPDGALLEAATPLPMPTGALYRQVGYNDIQETLQKYQESGRAVFAGFFTVDVDEPKHIAMGYTLPPDVLTAGSERLGYRLQILKQPGARDIPVEVVVRPPKGYLILEAGFPVESMTKDEARFSLILNADVDLSVVMEPR